MENIIFSNTQKRIDKIEGYINYFSGDIPLEKCKKRRIEGDLSQEELELVDNIRIEFAQKCNDFLNKKIGIDEISKYGGHIMYEKYNPDMLYDLLSPALYDCLMLLDEYSFLKSRSKNI